MAAAVAGLVSAGGADAATHAAAARTPSLQATIDNGQLQLTGNRTLPAGRLHLSLTSVGQESTLQLGRLHKGYTWKDFRADIRAFGKSFGPNGPSKSGLRHLNHAIDSTDQLGGLDAEAGGSTSGTFLLHRAGRYVVFNDSGNLPKQPQWLTVTAPAGPQHLPVTSVTVTARTDRRFGGASVLPAHGTITFRNKSTESPHFLGLLHVKEGTTRKQVIQAFSTQSPTQPDFILPGSGGTDIVGKGRAQTFHYRLPVGEYAEFCFFPDPKTGMPHALMGMVRIVHLEV
ncbi:MAG TPA: hypothetical protein VFT62_03670 [Mycobacteriales bacterium]|nr:hypothetical protein [Mycobacteriales bacterium]